MNRRSRVFVLILTGIVTTVSIIGLKALVRHREIRTFFQEADQLAWAQKYLDQKINFCDAPWQHMRVEKNQSGERYVSPSGQFTVKIYTNASFEETFDLIETNGQSAPFTFSFSWDPKGGGLNSSNFKWIQNERYLAFRKPLTIDNDWGTSKIYIYDLKLGGVIYLGDSEFYDCESRNW